MDDRDFFERNPVRGHEGVASVSAIGDDVTDQAQRATEEPGKFFPGAHGGNDHGARILGLEAAGVAVRHPAQAKNDVGLQSGGDSEQSGREPVEVKIERLQNDVRDARIDAGGQRAARAEGEQRGVVSGGREGVREQNGLSLGPAAPQVILNNEDFHCPAERPEDSLRRVMNSSFNQLLVRWLVLALGVVLATRLVNGISYDSGATLLVVVLLLSFFNAILKPLLLLFTLPFIVLTMGLGVILINALLFLWVGKLVEGFYVASFWVAVKGAIVVSLTNLVVSAFVRSPKREGPKPPAPPAAPSSKRPKDDDVIDI